VKLLTRLIRKLIMTVESKLDALTAATAQIATAQAANQAAILTAIQAITPGGSTAITAALAQIETQVAAIQSTLGTDSSGSGSASGASNGSAPATTAQAS
jgi:hypothetical protein